MNIEKYGLTLETALFPFLFPHRHGAYDEKITFIEYLKYRMETLFFFFNLIRTIFIIYVRHASIFAIIERNFKNVFRE